jgi:RNA polymerase sigma-70 factor, ECF subfamily
MEDQGLLKRLKKDDEKAFEELFKVYFFELHQYAFFYIEDSQLAEDLVHDIFFRIWEKRDNIKIHTSIRAYLYRAVHNICIQQLRHLKVRRQHGIKHKAKFDEAMIMNKLYFEIGLGKLYENEINNLVNDALRKLTGKTRDIYVLSREKHNTIPQIAKILNISEKGVEYHLTKALSILRGVLKDYF